MGENTGQGGGSKMTPPGEDGLASAEPVRQVSRGLENLQMADLFMSCHTLTSAGVALAWALCNAEETSRLQGNHKFMDGIFNSGAWPKARRRRQAFPMSLGDFTEVDVVLKKTPIEQIRDGSLALQWGRQCWIMAACFACNGLAGAQAPFRPGRWSKSERRLAEAVGKAVDRLLDLGRADRFEPAEIEKELRGRRLNYDGEEIGICHALTLGQVLPALPPPDHGGSIDLVRFLSESSVAFLRHPSKHVVDDVGQDLPKLQGKIHIAGGEVDGIARELVRRNICSWIPLESVLSFRGEKVLNGMFGVAKSSTTLTGKTTLRLIMNLVPSNAVLRSYVGTVKSLPQITSWMSITLEEGEEVRIWQSDMSNAFYLFQLPLNWGPYLAFNIVRNGLDIGETPGKQFALSCRVLPMGWTNSVALMQEASERILIWGCLDKASQISRGIPLPNWITGVIGEAVESGKTFWHVYLDNFAAGEIGDATSSFNHGEVLHQLAEKAWAEARVVSSEKKKRTAVVQAQELGAFIDGRSQTLGGSPERLIKLAQATLFLLSKPHLSKKLTQVIAGRWVHVFQFRRPAMALMESVWEFTTQKGICPVLVRKTRRELFSCICAIPFLHTFLGAEVSEVITASDASMRGGAVGMANTLTTEGMDYVQSISDFPRPRRIPVLLVSLFSGIGGALRAYDLLGLVPTGIVVFEIHKPANRVTGKRWPQAEIMGDVKTLNAEMVRDWVQRYVPLKELHLWFGFPCVDLSSVRAGRLGLDGPNSGLFWDVIDIIRLLEQELPAHISLKYVGENVASMNKAHCQEITNALGVRPYHLNPVDAGPMQRPRLCWTTEELQDTLDGLEFVERDHWTSIKAEAPWPEVSQWISPDTVWPGGDEGHALPTAMKSIKRKRPPPAPAGIDRCDSDTLQRWEADNFRNPPYHYQGRFIFWHHDRWRLCNASEKELLLGYGWGHTELCYSASDIKSNPEGYQDERLSLLGDSFSLFSFIIPAYGLCTKYLPKLAYTFLARRMGMAPGFCAALQLQAPIQRYLQYGCRERGLLKTLQQLNRILLTRVNHTGSDIKITTGEVFAPRAVPRQSVQADWWNWEHLFTTRWQHSEHINILELRSILLSAKYQILNLHAVDARIFHVTDSFVCLSIVAKGRTGSRRLGRVLKELNAWLLGFGITMVLGHVESSENPTDGASRSIALLQPAHES